VPEGDAGVVVDCHEQHLPARTIDGIASVASHVVAGPLDATKLLGADVQHVARRFVLVAHDWLGRIEMAQQGQARTREHPADSALGDPERRDDARLGACAACARIRVTGFLVATPPSSARRPRVAMSSLACIDKVTRDTARRA
jgi:hypothetical protein